MEKIHRGVSCTANENWAGSFVSYSWSYPLLDCRQGGGYRVRHWEACESNLLGLITLRKKHNSKL